MTFPTLTAEAGFAGGASTAAYLHLDDVARGLLDTATLAGSAPFEDISAYVIGRVQISRRANRVESPIVRYEAGTCTAELNNSDRRFDPTNLSGPYVSAGVTQVTPMRAVRLFATWNGVIYPLYRGFADDWKIAYSGPNVSICELSCTDAIKVLSSYDRNAVAAVGSGENAGARVTRILDSVGWSASDRMIATGNTTLQSTTLSDNTWTELLLTQDTEIGEIYVDAAGRIAFRNRQAAMTEMRSIAANAVFGGTPTLGVETTINLATNPSVETDLTGWSGGGTLPPTLTQSSAQALFGTKSVLATWDTDGVLPLVQYTQTGLQVGHTYTMSYYVYVPTGSPDASIVLGGIAIGGTNEGVKDQWVRLSWTDVATSSTWLVQLWPVTTPTAGDQVYVDGLQVEESGSATAYCDGAQTNCEWDGTAHASTSRRLPELPYADVEVATDAETLANLVQITRVGGSQQTAQDATSQELYLTRTHRRTDLTMQTDAVAAEYANFILYQSKDPELRFASITIYPGVAPDELYPQVLGRRLGDRIRVIKRPPGGGTITREAFIRGIEHTIQPGGEWKTVWQLQSATKWAFFVLDNNTLGALDENALAY